jgi:hypothetical protein
MSAQQDFDTVEDKVSRSPKRLPPPPLNNSPRLESDEMLLIKIRVTCSDQASMLRECNVAKLTELQSSISSSIKLRLNDRIFVRISFYKGSLIVLATITVGTALILNSQAFRFIKGDIENIVRKTFAKLSSVSASVDYKKVKKALDIFGDVLSIFSKLLTIFGSSNIPPWPSSFGPDGWTTV